MPSRRLVSAATAGDSLSESGDAASIRVLVVAEVNLFREGVARFLDAQTGIDVVGTARPAEVAAVLAGAEPEIVLWNIPAGHDLRAIPFLLNQRWGLKVVVTGVGETEEDLVACARAGISGYVPRDGSLDDLLNSIQAASRGEFACSPSAAATLLRAAGTRSRGGADVDPDQLLGALTRREVEIVGLIAEDLSNKQIASTLHVALSTVKNHIHNVMQKLHTSRRSEIAALAHEAGLVPDRMGSRSVRT